MAANPSRRSVPGWPGPHPSAGRFPAQRPGTAIDPAFADLGFFGELGHHVAVKDQAPKTGRGPYRRDGSQAPMGLVKFQQFFHVHIADAVPVGH